jgi:hypothetical protein
MPNQVFPTFFVNSRGKHLLTGTVSHQEAGIVSSGRWSFQENDLPGALRALLNPEHSERLPQRPAAQLGLADARGTHWRVVAFHSWKPHVVKEILLSRWGPI